jgi:hypothetical protein
VSATTTSPDCAPMSAPRGRPDAWARPSSPRPSRARGPEPTLDQPRFTHASLHRLGDGAQGIAVEVDQRIIENELAAKWGHRVGVERKAVVARDHSTTSRATTRDRNAQTASCRDRPCLRCRPCPVAGRSVDRPSACAGSATVRYDRRGPSRVRRRRAAPIRRVVVRPVQRSDEVQKVDIVRRRRKVSQRVFEAGPHRRDLAHLLQPRALLVAEEFETSASPGLPPPLKNSIARNWKDWNPRPD